MNWTEELKSEDAKKLYIHPEHRTCVYQFSRTTEYGAEVIVKQVMCESEVQAKKAEAEAQIVIDHPHPQINPCLGCKREPKSGGGFYVYIFAVPMLRSLFDDINSRASVEHFYSEAELWGFYHSLLEPLHHLQCLGISHRDIKPHNILLDSQGCIKLCDFGYAKKIDKQAPGEHSLLGSALYWSPLLRKAYMTGNIATVQHNPFKSDVFSLGLTLVNLTLLALPKPLENLTDLQQFIDAELNGISRYSQSWMELLRSILRVDEAHRPDFIALRTPALYEDDEELPVVLGGEVCEQPLQLSAKCGYTHVRVSDQSVDEVPCMITIQACSQPLGQRTYGVDLICVIDQSGSMEGMVMNLVKTSLNGLLTRLNDRDRMALVGFNDVAERKCQLICCNEEGKCRLRGLIQQVLNCRGLTNIAKGFQMGLEVLKRRRTVNQASSLLLFQTDATTWTGTPLCPACLHCNTATCLNSLSAHSASAVTWTPSCWKRLPIPRKDSSSTSLRSTRFPRYLTMHWEISRL
jgi:serine/threonine protein kinase